MEKSIEHLRQPLGQLREEIGVSPSSALLSVICCKIFPIMLWKTVIMDIFRYCEANCSDERDTVLQNRYIEGNLQFN